MLCISNSLAGKRIYLKAAASTAVGNNAVSVAITAGPPKDICTYSACHVHTVDASAASARICTFNLIYAEI